MYCLVRWDSAKGLHSLLNELLNGIKKQFKINMYPSRMKKKTPSNSCAPYPQPMPN